MSKETTLWRTVLADAILDHAKGIDETYINLDNKDFITVCGLASLEPHTVIEQAYKYKNKIIPMPKLTDKKKQ
jgi:hypothetical protein